MEPAGTSFYDHIRGLVGTEFFVGEWIPITQERIDAFARATGDDQWIHTNPERARRESPFGTTVAHGYLTISLLPSQTLAFFKKTGVGRALNYGLNKVRFPAPVLVGSRIRAHFVLASAEKAGEGVKIAVDVTVEADNQKRPVCSAQTVSIIFPAGGGPG